MLSAHDKSMVTMSTPVARGVAASVRKYNDRSFAMDFGIYDGSLAEAVIFSDRERGDV